MEQNKITQWVKKNKVFSGIAFIFLGVLILLILPGVLGLIGQQSYKQNDYYYTEELAPMSSTSYPSLGFDLFDSGSSQQETRTTSTQLDIKEGNVDVKSEDAENDFEILKNILTQENGHVETSRKNESNTSLLITAQVRIPVESFENFAEKIQTTFKVENFHLSNYKIDVQRQIDEMEIVKQALEDYNIIREETMRLENGEERITLLSRITNEMQNLARQQRDLERDLGSKEEKSDFATINISFEQKLRADLWPEDLGNFFFDRINWAVDSIVKTSISFIANSFVLIVKVVEYIIYAVIVIVPVVFAWNLGSKMRKKKGSRVE